MIDFRNPYTPGAGMMPKYLAGRNTELESAEQRLLAIKAGYLARSVVYYGLRGVGKTVVLNAVAERAEDQGLLSRHIVDTLRSQRNPGASFVPFHMLVARSSLVSAPRRRFRTSSVS